MTDLSKVETELEYRVCIQADLCDSLLDDFERRQEVKRCWRTIDGQMQLMDVPFVDDWDQAQRQEVIIALRETMRQDGLVFGAFLNGALKGFVSVSPVAFGSEGQYLDLPMLHVSAEMRGCGIGKALLQRAKTWARRRGASKIYLSAHSSEESQAFYRAAGAVEAEEIDPIHAANEPFDCQMELPL
jgi:predicted N-acetyltransferase YhbS